MRKGYAQSTWNRTVHLAKRCCHGLLVLLLLGLPLQYGQAQVVVTYPQQAQDVVTCNQPGDLRVRILFVDEQADEPVIRINLPPGVVYETGSLTAISGTLSIIEGDLSDPGAPQFLVTPSNIFANDLLDFTISRSGGCEARAFAVDGGLFKDTVSVQTGMGTYVEDNPSLNTYNLLFASLSHQYPNGSGSQDTIISDVPQAISRPVRLTQGGLGFVDTVTYFVVLGDVQAYELSYAGSPLTPVFTNGDTLFYGLSEFGQPGIFGPDNRFSNGEQIDFTERFEVQTCAQALNLVKHHASWGCGPDICQRSVPVTGSVAVIVPQPALETGQLFDRSLPACLDGATPDQYGFYMENTGLTTALVGVQLGFQGNTALPIFGDYGSNNASLDTASITMNIDGMDITRSPDAVHDGVNFCLGGLPGGRVSAARYFGITLLPGERLEITGNYVYCCRESCNDSYSWSTPIARFQVRDACGNIPRLEIASHDFADARLNTAPTIISGPATIFDGDTVTYCFEYPSLDGYPNAGGDNTYTVELGLPGGFALQPTGNAEVKDRTGAPLPFQLTGVGTDRPAIKINQSDYGEGAVVFCLELAWECGGAGLVEMPVELRQTVGSECPESCDLGISCSSFPVLLFCPGGSCDGGGGSVSSSTTQRANIGYADTDNNRVWETHASANPEEVRLDRAAPCDTVVTQASLSILPGTDAPWAQGRFRQTVLYPFFRPIGAKAEIFDNGTLIGTVDNFPATQVQGDSVFDYHLSAALLHQLNPDFPEAFQFSTGDSVYIETRYYFDEQLADGSFYDFGIEGFNPITVYCVENQDIQNTFQLSNDDFQTISACGFTIDRVQLVSAAVSFASGGQRRFSGCEELIWEVFTRTQRGCVTGLDIDFFPNEFRPVFAFDTFALAKIPGYTFKRLQYRRSPEVFTVDIPPFAEDADSLYFDVRNFYSDRGGPIPLWEEQARDEILKSFWQPSCASEEGAVYGRASVGYVDPSCSKRYTKAQERELSYMPIGQFSFVLNPLVSNAFTEESCFTLSAANTGVGNGFNVPYTWLEVVNPDGTIMVEQVRKNDGPPLSPVSLGLYELGEHPNNSTEQIEICVSQNSCLPDSFLVVYGWNCEGYPATDNLIEACFLDTLVAYVNPQLAEVQLQITDQPSPSESLELCDTDTIEVLVNSAQQADLVDPVLDVILPPGVAVNSMQAGYPNDNNIVFEPLSGLISGDTVSFDLTAHSRILGDSLPGTFNNPGIANRQMRLVFEIETGCGFDPSQSIAFYRARGLSPCSDPAIGSDILVASNPINVAGTDAPYETIPEVLIDAPLQGCGSTARVQANFTLLGGETTGRDTAVMIVPPGISYVEGSLICESPEAESCPVFAGNGLSDDGNIEFRFAIPPGLNDGTTVAFSFEIAEEGADCATPATGLFRTVITRNPLVCNGVPCLTELEVVTGQDSLPLFILKPEYDLSGFTACVNEEGQFQIDGNLVLSNIGQAPDGSVTVSVYCLTDSTASAQFPVAGIDISGPLSPGTELPLNFSGATCTDVSAFRLEAVPSCGCGTATLFLPLETPQVLSCPNDFDLCLDGNPLPLEGASPAGGIYEGPGVVDGVFDPAFAGAGEHTLVYTYTGELGCQKSCSFVATVSPLPEVNCPTLPEVCISAAPIPLEGAFPAGGVYQGAGVVDGVFDPGAAGVGVHSLMYTYTDTLGCQNSCSFEARVRALPDVSCPSVPVVCEDAGPLALSGGLPEGGMYSGTGVANGLFDPLATGPGTHTVAYTFVDSAGCSNSCAFAVEVSSPGEVICPSGTEVCVDEAAFVLSGGLPLGGVYSGQGVLGDQFDPATAGVGAHTIEYTYTDNNNCANSCSFEIVVSPVPDVTCPDDFEVSVGSGILELDGGLPSGGQYSGPGIANGEFDPAAAGVGDHQVTYVYTAPSGCTDSCDFVVTVTSVIAEVGDFAWFDANQNGLQEAAEPGLSGVKVILEGEEGDTFTPVDTTVSNAEGHYLFQTGPGVYRVRFIPVNGMSFAQPEQGGDNEVDSDATEEGYTSSFSLAEGASNLSIDAGFISLCSNVTSAGHIGPDQYLCAPGNTPDPIESLSAPEGGNGALEYVWMQSTVAGPFNLQTWEMIPNSNTTAYAPGPLSQTTYFARCARRENCAVYLESNIVTVEVGNEVVAEINGADVLCVGEPATFTAVDPDPDAIYEWSMGLGLSPLGANGPEVTLSAPYSHGRFPVTLSVTQNGCTAVETYQITATKNPYYCGTPLPLNASPVENQGDRCIKITWRLEELGQDYTHTLQYAGPGAEEFVPFARYKEPSSYLGDQNYYEHLHENPRRGVHRYRVKVEMEGDDLLYSELALVALLEEVTLFPNPAQHRLTVAVSNPFVPGDRLELFNAFGQRLQIVRVETGETQVDLDISNLPVGTYFVRFWQGQSRWEVLRFTKE